ncbi:bifunctional 3-dehydroquinate dehydratase/shikimate dehydrogenase [Quercus suber]|uniref:Bifunctional 3-dehydroquinate dehydratase/shikimate dehydrogenase n=1 Tax=Quercus suber TaxID=58331 RepID=A0AAW0LIM9_QUESU
MGSVGMMDSKTTLVCAPLMAETVEQIMTDMYKAKVQGADLVEIRLDYIKNFQPRQDLETILKKKPLPVLIVYRLDYIKNFQPRQDLETILKKKPLPVLIVYRPKWEGGQYEGDEHTRLETLHTAKELGADYIDFEFKVASNLMEQLKMNCHSGSKVIVSCYVNGVTPLEEDLNHLVTSMQSTGADIIKLVINATNITEISRIFHLLSHCQVPLIAYSIGERGLISQILCPKLGGFLVYGSMEGNSVPGLPTLENLRQAYKVEDIDEDTKVFGLISKPVGHSKGPLLHNPTFRRVKYNAIYVPMFVDDLKDFFSVYSSPEFDFAGFSVGFPYKEAVVEFCDEVHPLAKAIGAVNTIVRRPSDGKWVGYNTDLEASITAIEDALKHRGCTNGETSFDSPLAGKQFVLAGAGGAGRALAFGAKSRGARVVILCVVGFPYKEAVVEFCDEVHPLAKAIGAVNTIVRRPSDGKWVGYNTDLEASITAIEDALKHRGCTNGETSFDSPLAGKQFVLAGAGGAGRALAFGAKSRGARVVIFDIDFERAKTLAHEVSGEARPFEEVFNFHPEKGAILANATPLGMHPNSDRIPVAEVTLQDYQLVFDSVYTPRKTRLLKDAEAAGAIIVSGVEMFLRQAIGQFNLFTGKEAPEEFMRDIILAKF